MIEMPVSRPLTRADLADRPDDGHRYELLDGVLIVTPAPSPRHQHASRNLFRILDRACPESSELYFAPLDVELADDTVLEPDLLVVDRKQLTAREVLGAPLLAVEVLSPNTRRFDLHTKRARYEAAGTAGYWVVDPGEPPSLTAWELRDGAYVEVASVSGPEKFAAEVPLPVTVVPDELVDRTLPL